MVASKRGGRQEDNARGRRETLGLFASGQKPVFVIHDLSSMRGRIAEEVFDLMVLGSVKRYTMRLIQKNHD
jgi:hypothetical protein